MAGGPPLVDAVAMEPAEFLLDHARHPRHRGRLERPSVSVVVTNPACGDTLLLEWIVKAGTIVEVAHEIQGCPAARGVASFLAESLVGKRVADARALSRRALEDALGTFPRGKIHALHLALDAVGQALASVAATTERT